MNLTVETNVRSLKRGTSATERILGMAERDFYPRHRHIDVFPTQREVRLTRVQTRPLHANIVHTSQVVECTSIKTICSLLRTGPHMNCHRAIGTKEL